MYIGDGRYNILTGISDISGQKALQDLARREEGGIKEETSINIDLSSKTAMLRESIWFRFDHGWSNIRFKRTTSKIDVFKKHKMRTRPLDSVDRDSRVKVEEALLQFLSDSSLDKLNIDWFNSIIREFLTANKMLKQGQSEIKVLAQLTPRLLGAKIQFEVSSFGQLTLEVLEFYCNSSKDISMNFQEWLDRCGKEKTRLVGLRMSQDYGMFVCHQYGSFVAQKLLQVDDHTVECLEDFSKRYFYDLLLNTNASRVLQSLVQVSVGFKLYASSKFQATLSLATSKMSIVYLYIACIENSPDTLKFDYLVDLMASDCGLMGSQKFIKVVAAFARVCRPSVVDRISEILSQRCTLLELVNQKSTMSLALVLISRKHKTFEQLLEETLERDFGLFCKSKYSRDLLAGVAELDSPEFKLRIARILDRVGITRLLKKQKSFTNLFFYLYIFIELIGDQGKAEVSLLLSRSDLRRFFGGFTEKARAVLATRELERDTRIMDIFKPKKS